MGLYDSIFGEVTCHNCKTNNITAIQFKFSNCQMDTYYIGDYFEDAITEYHIVREDYNSCTQCHTKLLSNAIIRKHKVIAILNDYELLETDLAALPDVADNYWRDFQYKKACDRAFGKACEKTVFSLHPLAMDETITALGHTWNLLEVYVKTVDKSHKRSTLIRLAGSMGRNSDIWYIYKAYNKIFGTRYIEISDYSKGQIEVFEEFTHKNGYMYEKLS